VGLISPLPVAQERLGKEMLVVRPASMRWRVVAALAGLALLHLGVVAAAAAVAQEPRQV